MTQPFLRQICFQAFLFSKNAWRAKIGILSPEPALNKHNAGTARPPKAIHASIYADGGCAYQASDMTIEQPAALVVVRLEACADRLRRLAPYILYQAYQL
jgi:hypothetical protein